MAIYTPERVWWKPLGREERRWVWVAAVWCLIMSLFLIGWYYLGAQQMPTQTQRITPAQFKTLTDEFVAANQVGEENGAPIVHPQPGSDIYLIGRQWQWWPILELEVGQTYTLHVSSLDVMHGLSIQPINLNAQILPGYDSIIQITPNKAGEYGVICNEFCSIGHHLMTGKIIVK